VVSNDRKALYLGLSAVLLWSTAATAFKLALRELDVFQLVAWSVSASALALLAIVCWQGRQRQLWRSLRERPGYFLVLAAINPLLYYLVLLHAYALLPAQQAQTINYTWAITLALLAVPLLGQRLGRRDLLAVALGYSGVVIIATQGQPFSLQFSSLPGVALALGSTLVWALYWILNTRNQGDPLVSLSLNFLLATPAAWLVCGLFSTFSTGGTSGLLAALYVGLFEMGITFALWSSALRLTTSVARIGNLIFLSPLFSLVFIATVLEETIHPATLVGLALIIPGVLLQQAGGTAASREA
jgi:drug/metabolite transporter (DMT)-like permease